MNVYLIRNKDGLWLMNYRITRPRETGPAFYTCIWGEMQQDAKAFVSYGSALAVSQGIGNCEVMKTLGTYEGVAK